MSSEVYLFPPPADRSLEREAFAAGVLEFAGVLELGLGTRASRAARLAATGGGHSAWVSLRAVDGPEYRCSNSDQARLVAS